MQKENKVKRIGLKIIIYGMVFLYILPVILVFTGVFMGDVELNDVLGAVVQESNQYATWHLIPLYPTGENILRVLLDTPEYFVLFWNSVKVVSCIIVGQFVFAIPAAWILARNHSCICKCIMLVYMFCMLLPFQVTMVPNVITLRAMGLLDTIWAIILPMTVAPFYIFLLRQYMVGLPGEMIEAAQIDGAGTFRCFIHVVLPVCQPILGAAVALSFADCWNLVEQPLTYLTTHTELYPLSVVFNQLTQQSTGVEFAGAALYTLPALLIYLYFQNDILEGVQLTELK